MDVLSIAIQEMERGAGEAGCDNGGSDVARYFGQPVRDGKNYGSWCAAFVSWCLVRGGVAIDDPRARRGAKRLVCYVASRGRWVYEPRVLKPAVKCCDPAPDDIIAWDRGAPGSWFGHVGIIERYDAVTGELWTIEGNASRYPCKVMRKRYSRTQWQRRLYGIARPPAQEKR